MSLSWFLVELEFGDICFSGGRKTREPVEKTLEQGENQRKTQPTYSTRMESNPGHNDERRVLPFSPTCTEFCQVALVEVISIDELV